MAGQEIFVSLTLHFFGLAVSILTPEISFAVPLQPDDEEPTQSGQLITAVLQETARPRFVLVASTEDCRAGGLIGTTP